MPYLIALLILAGFALAIALSEADYRLNAVITQTKDHQ
jgi:hypothetical protein